MPGNALDYINQSNSWQDDPNAQWRQNAPGSVPVGPPGAATVPPWWPYWSGAPGWYPQGQGRAQAQPEWFMPENYGGGPAGGQPTYNLAPPALPYRGWQGGGPAQQPAAMPRQSVASPQPTGAMPVVPIDAQTGKPTGGGVDTGPATPPQWLAMLAQQQAGGRNALQQGSGQLNWMQQLQLQNPSFLDMLMRWIGLRQQQYGAPGQAQGRRPGDGPGLTTTPNDNGFILL